MTALRDFVADLMERDGAAVETLEPDGLAVIAPPEVRSAFGWPELARLGFGVELPVGAQRIGVEGHFIHAASKGAMTRLRSRADAPRVITGGINGLVNDGVGSLGHGIHIKERIRPIPGDGQVIPPQQRDFRTGKRVHRRAPAL